MKEKIKQIRVRIDGLAGLIKADLDKPIYIIDANSIPPNMTTEDVLNELKKPGTVILDNVKHETIHPNYSMSFVFEAYKSLLLAKAWLGKVLAVLGEETPYKSDGKRESVKDIEPTADRATKKIESEVFNHGMEWQEDTYIQKIDWLREEIKGIIEKELNEIYNSFDDLKDIKAEKIILFSHNIYVHLSEARFHLGFELGRIKELDNENV